MSNQPEDKRLETKAQSAQKTQGAQPEGTQKRDKAKNRKGKTKVLHWRGIMADSSREVRIVTAIVLLLGTAALIYTQLGFVGIGLPGQYAAYAVVTLQPVALGALFFGAFAGAGFGLFAGSLMLAHAYLMPLDYYELNFITPWTSIVILIPLGFLLGILFARALRNNPSWPRCFIHIVLISILVSALYSLGFWVNALASVIADTAASNAQVAAAVDDQAIEVASTALERNVVDAVTRMGDMTIQAAVDAVLMVIACMLGIWVARRIRHLEGTVGLRTLFASRMLVVVTIVFMAAAIASFVGISILEQRSGEDLMQGELDYLNAQIAESEKRSDAFADFFASAGVDAEKLSGEQVDDAMEAVSMTELLKGYEVKDDGTLLIVANVDGDESVYATNEESYADQELEDIFDEKTIEAMRKSIETGRAQRIVFDDPQREDKLDFENMTISTQLAYLLANRSIVDEENDYTLTPVIIRPADMVYADRPGIMAWISVMSLLLLLAVLALTSRLLNNVVARRIDETNGVLAQVTKGNLDARVSIHDTREFESLSTGINSTVETLKGWIAEAETRMDAELATAKAIQESALPRVFPPFPDIMRFDIYASMNAANEVGGDFYDFFTIGEDCTPEAGKLGFLIADVSGKGVPAALFMMNAKALVRGYMESGLELGEAVENANRQLCDGNDAGMFVTAWIGVLDYATYHVDYVNAGHNPPLLWQNGGWTWMEQKSGLPLGLYAELPYKAHSLECSTGDQLFLYTDGVTEAMSVTEELYGEARLEGLASKCYPLHPRQLIEEVRHSVAEHAKGAEQSDDITMLALEVGVPPEITATLALPAVDVHLPRVVEFIHNELDRRLCPIRVQHQIDIAVEELFVNVTHYAYPDATPENPGEVRISYTYSANPTSIQVDIIDSGIPYNPLEKPDAVTPDNIADVPIGGLGILMAKKSVDEMTYKYEDGRNIVSIVKKW